MEELFLETETGKIPLGAREIEKYGLKKGMYSPFLRRRIVDAAGSFTPERQTVTPVAEIGEESQIMTTSEIYDFMQASDSTDA